MVEAGIFDRIHVLFPMHRGVDHHTHAEGEYNYPSMAAPLVASRHGNSHVHEMVAEEIAEGEITGASSEVEGLSGAHGHVEKGDDAEGRYNS